MSETQNTGQFAKTIVTDVGKDMIAKSQNGQTLTFSRVALGDGLVGEEEDVTKFTAVKNERLSLPIAKYSNLGNGQFQIQFRLTNSQVESGFWHREIGIMAKIDNGQEQLYAYTTAGNKASFIYDKTTPVEERIVNVNFVIGNAQNLEVIINSSVIYATIEDLEEALDAHDAGDDAHEAAFTAHNAADNAHKDMVGATAEAAGKRGMVPAPAAGTANRYLKADGRWGTIDTMNGASSSESGNEGLVPAPGAGAQNKFLRGDGTWADAKMSTKELVDILYPVGHIYMSTNSANPGTLFPGTTWEAYAQGRVLIGAGTGTDSRSEQKTFAAGSTGGEYNHQLTVGELASHNHTGSVASASLTGSATQGTGQFDSATGIITLSNSQVHIDSSVGGGGYRTININASHGHTVSINNTGSGQVHNNLQPYLVCYIWRRTA